MIYLTHPSLYHCTQLCCMGSAGDDIKKKSLLLMDNQICSPGGFVVWSVDSVTMVHILNIDLKSCSVSSVGVHPLCLQLRLL